jgi:hypothetical protein
MKNLILSCLAVCVLASIVGCSDTKSDTATTTSSSSAMAPDTKDMKK